MKYAWFIVCVLALIATQGAAAYHTSHTSLHVDTYEPVVHHKYAAQFHKSPAYVPEMRYISYRPARSYGYGHHWYTMRHDIQPRVYSYTYS